MTGTELPSSQKSGQKISTADRIGECGGPNSTEETNDSPLLHSYPEPEPTIIQPHQSGRNGQLCRNSRPSLFFLIKFIFLFFSSPPYDRVPDRLHALHFSDPTWLVELRCRSLRQHSGKTMWRTHSAFSILSSTSEVAWRTE